jgi:fructose transport system substrate-binding protein
MASMALEAIATGKLPEIDAKLGFFDTGATLITDKPVEGLESIDTAKGAELCWG